MTNNYLAIINYFGGYSIYRKRTDELSDNERSDLKEKLNDWLEEEGLHYGYWVMREENHSMLERINHKLEEFKDEQDIKVFLKAREIAGRPF